MATQAPGDPTYRKTTGQLAFDAAYDFLECHGKGPDGEELLRWSQLSPEVQDAWQAAANAIADHAKQQVIRPLRLI